MASAIARATTEEFDRQSARLDGTPGQSLAKLVEAVLDAAAHNPHTRRAYRTALGLFLQFLDRERGQELPEEWRPLAMATPHGRRTIWTYRGEAVVFRLVDAHLVDSFRAWRETEGDSQSAAIARWAAVRSCLSVVYRQGILPAAQAQAMGLKTFRRRLARSPQPPGRRLSEEEVLRLLAVVMADTPKARRDRAILEAMLFLGLRREEVAGLKLADFHQEGNHWSVTVTGTHGKKRRLEVSETLLESLAAWLESAGLQLGAEGPAFTSLNKGGRVTGRPIHPSVIGRLVAEYGYAAGLAPLSGPQRLSPHDIRRTCACTAYDHGANVLLIQAMLGHNDSRTTARYIGASDLDSRTAVDYVWYGTRR